MSDKSALTVEISGTNCKLSKAQSAYIEKKCRKLTKHLSNHSKSSAFISVKVTELDGKVGDRFQCDATLTLPDKTMAASEPASTLNAAIDIVENKLQRQIRKYKTERRSDGLTKGGVMARIKRCLRRR